MKIKQLKDQLKHLQQQQQQEELTKRSIVKASQSSKIGKIHMFIYSQINT